MKKLNCCFIYSNRATIAFQNGTFDVPRAASGDRTVIHAGKLENKVTVSGKAKLLKSFEAVLTLKPPKTTTANWAFV